MQELIAEYGTMKGELVKFVNQITTIFQESGNAIIEETEQTFDHIRQTIKQRINETVEATKKAGKDATAYARENPFQVAAAALAVGMVVGLLMNEKERDKPI